MDWGLEIASDAIRICRAGLRHERAEIRRLDEVPVDRGLIQEIDAGTPPSPPALSAPGGTTLHRFRRRK